MSDTTKKRYAFIPLEEAKKETSLKGEILVNRETGHFFVKDDFGNIKSATQNLETKLNEIIDNSYFEQTDGKYNTTRKAYKFYFDGTDKLRLDRSLKVPAGAMFFDVKDKEDESVHYLQQISPVSEDALYIGNLTNNAQYWVIFYNAQGESLTQHLFVAKRADSVLADVVPTDKLLNRIEIEVSRDSIYLGDSWNDVFIRVYAYYEDHSRKDVTYDNGTLIHRPSLSTIGIKTITASYFNIDDNTFSTATRNISVIEEKITVIESMDIDPRVIITQNGKKNIKLDIFGTFDDGRVINITNRCVIEDFDETLFNEHQTIKVYTNYGREYVFEMEFTIKVTMNQEPYTVYFNDELIFLDPKLNIKPYPYFRVRNAGDLDNFYTLNYVNTGYTADYVGTLRTGSNLIIEYFDKDRDIKESVYAVCEYKNEIIQGQEQGLDQMKLSPNPDFFNPTLLPSNDEILK